MKSRTLFFLEFLGRPCAALKPFDQSEYLEQGMIELYMIVSPYLCADSHRVISISSAPVLQCGNETVFLPMAALPLPNYENALKITLYRQRIRRIAFFGATSAAKKKPTPAASLFGIRWLRKQIRR